MITFLHGKLVSALPTLATVDVNGVGYEVFIPLSSYDKLPTVGQPIRILTHLAAREDAHILYGFITVPVLALIALGYKQVDAHKAVRDLQTQGQAKSAEELVKLALKKMAAGR